MRPLVATVAQLLHQRALGATEGSGEHLVTPTLFPDLAADWLRLCEQAERLAGLGDLVDVTAATVDGARRRRGRAPGRPQIDLHQLRAAALEGAPDEAASLVDAARAAALDTLGDTDGVAAIAERRLRAERGA